MEWCIVYDFVFDRLRAVRQDLVIQGLGSVDSIKVLEPIVRFHCYAGYRYEWYSMPLESLIIFKLTNGLS
jgi:hypothetical protein